MKVTFALLGIFLYIRSRVWKHANFKILTDGEVACDIYWPKFSILCTI